MINRGASVDVWRFEIVSKTLREKCKSLGMPVTRDSAVKLWDTLERARGSCFLVRDVMKWRHRNGLSRFDVNAAPSARTILLREEYRDGIGRRVIADRDFLDNRQELNRLKRKDFFDKCAALGVSVHYSRIVYRRWE
ncbi:unnamed protein product, partial [Amoebophrya sp. A25]|eukprot:GSA25T00023401001.1